MSDLKVLTKDGEVSNIDMIQVRVGKREIDPIITLSYINTRLAILYTQLQDVKSEIIKLEGLKLEIETLAKKVILKEIETKIV